MQDKTQEKLTYQEKRCADFLTAAFGICRKNDAPVTSGIKRSALRQFGMLLLLTIDLAVVSAAPAQDWQPTGDIARAAEEFLQSRVGKADQRVHPKAGYLDTRLRLPLCNSELDPFLRRGTKVTSRTVVGVRCNGSRPWKVYVPVDVVVMDHVMVTKKTLARGHILSAADFVSEERNISALTGGYISDPEKLIGQRLKHQLIGGRIVTPAMLAADLIIKRGQTVTLLVQIDGLVISMSGKALMDGAVNQRIRVENSVSHRTVEGLVRSPQIVEILVN